MRMGNTRLNKIIVLLVACVIGSPVTSFSQDVDGLLTLIREGELDSAKIVLSDLSFAHPGHPGQTALCPGSRVVKRRPGTRGSLLRSKRPLIRPGIGGDGFEFLRIWICPGSNPFHLAKSERYCYGCFGGHEAVLEMRSRKSS